MQDELQELLDQIKEAEAHLMELRKEYREKRTAGLRAAIEARNEADAMIREEMKAMGYSGLTWRISALMPPNFKQFKAARKYGYRSGLELKIAETLKELKVKYDYECIKIEWEDLAYRTYTPDFVLFNGIIIETKGHVYCC